MSGTQRHFAPRRQRADGLGRPRHGLPVDRELGRAHQGDLGPALETLVVIVIGRLGVKSPPESSSGATDPFGPAGRLSNRS